MILNGKEHTQLYHFNVCMCVFLSVMVEPKKNSVLSLK